MAALPLVESQLVSGVIVKSPWTRGHLTLIDLDEVCFSNLSRQAEATRATAVSQSGCVVVATHSHRAVVERILLLPPLLLPIF